MTNRSTGPACGNNPNHPLTDGDRRAVENFKAYLQQRADGRGPETARELLYQRGLPEDVIDGALCLHAQELAALQRLRMDELDLTGQKARFVGRIVDLIDPTKTAAPAVSLPPVGQVDDVRDQLLHAIDFNYAVSLGYSTPEELLAAYDASRTHADRVAVLRWAADHLDNSERLRDLTDDHMLDINAAANELRRMADDEPAAECPQYGTTGACNGGPCPLRRLADETQPARSDVGSEFILQADHPDQAGLTAWEADLAESAPTTEQLAALAVNTRPRADRAAVLREVAEELAAESRHMKENGADAAAAAWQRAAERVRRMTTETPARRSPSERAVERVEGLAYFWETHDGVPYAQSLRAALAGPSTPAAAEHQPAAGARQDGAPR